MTSRTRTVAATAALAVVLLPLGCGRDRAPTPPAAAASPAAPPELAWGGDWNAAQARAAAEQRPLVVVFTAEWCLWCRRLESTTFADPAVRAALAGAVLLDLDVDQRDGRQRAASLGVEGPPTTVVLSASGSERGRIAGYLPPTEYLAQLESLLAR